MNESFACYGGYQWQTNKARRFRMGHNEMCQGACFFYEAVDHNPYSLRHRFWNCVDRDICDAFNATLNHCPESSNDTSVGFIERFCCADNINVLPS